MVLQEWGDAIIASLQQVFSSVVSFVPLLIGAIVVFIIGWIIALAFGKVVEQIVRALRVDILLQKLEFEKAVERAGWHLNAGAFLGGLVKWFLIVVFLLASINILGLQDVSNFLRDVLLYIPNVVVAALILIIAALLADVGENIVRGSVEAAGYKGALVGVVTRYAIWVFAFIAALTQLGVAVSLIQTIVTGLVGAVALAVGLSFGLGGKDVAAELISKIRGELKK